MTAIVALLMANAVPACPQAADPAALPALSGLSILYKLEAGVLGVSYGPRWLPGPTFTSTVQAGSVGVVDIRVRGIDVRRNVVPIAAAWDVADPELIAVTPGRNDEYRITTQRAGETRLTVSAQGFSTVLHVVADDRGNAIQLSVTEESAEDSAPVPDLAASATVGADCAGPAADAGMLTDQRARNSYAMGHEMGRRLKAMPVELDPELVIRGMQDAMSGETVLMDVPDRAAAIATLRRELRDRKRDTSR